MTTKHAVEAIINNNLEKLKEQMATFKLKPNSLEPATFLMRNQVYGEKEVSKKRPLRTLLETAEFLNRKEIVEYLLTIK